MSKRAKAKRARPVDAQVTEFDAYVPDYDGHCMNCDASPVVTATKGGQVVYEPMLCGPCLFGTADAIDPSTW